MVQPLEICVPDIGDFEEVEVVELLVAKGESVDLDDPLVSIESDKATMEIPSSAAGIVAEIRVGVGDRVSEGSVLVVLDQAEPREEQAEAPAPGGDEPAGGSGVTEGVSAESSPAQVQTESLEVSPVEAAVPAVEVSSVEAAVPAVDGTSATRGREMSAAASDPIPDRVGGPHASPLVRRYARELGVPIEVAVGTGPHGRVLVDDLRKQVRERFQAEPGLREPKGPALPAGRSVDAAAFGAVHEEPLTRIQKVAGPALHRSWLNVPHVTQHDEADFTEVERFRLERFEVAKERGIRLSPLVFVMKAVVIALREFPKFRSSLSAEGDTLVVKDYFHLGIAVETEGGLMVPVVRDVERKGLFELAEEIRLLSERARAGKLSPADLTGACFTISSLGGIGGRAFTPIVNTPEVAILGLSRTRVEPRWRGASPVAGPELEDGGEAGRFEPRLVLPISLSYDHRVIDGADAVRFTTRLAHLLADPVHLLL